ncbi:hypothetical protein [Legionella impletisoli]|uniref:Uncharacterized protein n=1 Tax=Legionella impletisoli TaxID=343510 RepID=A0A917JN12_9GAMM|nr:hypothetical protein [Legionella impletisoli]GGI78230.1 hypothetical protein GCM10007966_03660 [Legionella impletisoli]
MTNSNKPVSNRTVFLVLFLILAAILLWHFFLPILGIAIGMTALVWGILVSASVLTVILILLFFIFTGIGVIVLSLVGIVGFIVAIVIAPVVFPFLLPLLVLILFIAYIRRRSSK